MKYLYLENGTYFFKRKIPLTYKNYTISLRTGNLETAQYILATIAPKINLLFNLCKAKCMTYEEQFELMNHIIREYVKEAWLDYGDLAKLRYEAFTYTTKKGKRRDGAHPKAIDRALQIVEDEIYDIDSKSADDLIEALFGRSNINREDVEKIDDQYMFRTELLKAEFELLTCDKLRSEGRLATPYHLNKEVEPYVPKDIPQSVSFPEQSRVEKQKEIHSERYYEKTIKELMEEYILEKKEKMGKNVFNTFVEELNYFVNYCGQEYLFDITDDFFGKYARLVKNLPNKKLHRKLYVMFNREELSNKTRDELQAIVSTLFKNEESTIDELDMLADGTINDKLGYVSGLLDYAVKKNYIDKNRLKGERIEGAQPKFERVFFEEDEIKDMLTKTTWYGEELEKNLKERPERFFIPLIGIYHGFRGNEIAQLSMSSIVKKNGIDCFSIAVYDSKQKYKTNSSKRLIPIHSKIIELGFLKYIEQQKEKGEKQVFSNLRYDENSGYWKDFGDDFNEKLKPQFVDEEILNNPRIQVDFHSIRHLFGHMLKEVINDNTLIYLMGHSLKGKMTHDNYGKGRHGEKYRVDVLKSAIEQLSYDIDLSHLETATKKVFKT